MGSPARKGSEDLLHGWLGFLVELAAPWAKPVVAGLKVFIEIAKKNPSWNPPIPRPPSSEILNAANDHEKYLLRLDQALLAVPPPNVDYEKLNELLGYRELWRMYPDLHSRWIIPSEFGSPIAPFIELWTNIDPSAPALPIRFIPAQEQLYRPPALAQNLGATVNRLIAHKFKTDEPKLRICSTRREEDGYLCLEFAFCRYTDYLRTNWAVANLDATSAKQLREQLCGTGSIWPLDKSRCSNHLGVSAVIAFEDEILLPTSSTQVISSPEMIIPSASGSADFLGAYWVGQVPGAAQDIVREAQEELQIDTIQFRDASVRILALTRNVLRGGKPEAFYYIHLPWRREGSSTSFEHHLHSFVRLPSLLDKDNSPVPCFDEKVKEISALIYGTSHDEAVISPFTRVALHYYVLYAKGCRHAQPHNNTGTD